MDTKRTVEEVEVETNLDKGYSPNDGGKKELKSGDREDRDGRDGHRALENLTINQLTIISKPANIPDRLRSSEYILNT
jgi:hypothetical protein